MIKKKAASRIRLRLDKDRTEFCQLVLRIGVALLDEVDKTQSLIVVDDRLLFTVCCRIVVHHVFNVFSCRAKFTLFFWNKKIKPCKICLRLVFIDFLLEKTEYGLDNPANNHKDELYDTCYSVTCLPVLSMVIHSPFSLTSAVSAPNQK